MARSLAENEIDYDGKNMLCETDKEGVITFVNRKYVEQSAYEREELLGSPSNMLRHPDMPKCLYQTMWDALKDGQSWKGYMKNLRKDGKFFWIVLFISAKMDENGNHTGYVGAYKKATDTMIEEIENLYKEVFENESCGKEIQDIANLAHEDENR